VSLAQATPGSDASSEEDTRRSFASPDVIDALALPVSAPQHGLFRPLPPRSRRALLLAWVRERRASLASLASLAARLGLALLLSTAAAHAWGRPLLEAQLLPRAAAAVSDGLDRTLRLGRLCWLLPSGLSGLTPVAVLGPVSLSGSLVPEGEQSRCDVRRFGMDW
jgi:hypothetical protein